MKLGPVYKFDKKKTKKNKKKNKTKKKKTISITISITFLLTVIFYITKSGKRTKKSVTALTLLL